MRRFSVAVSPSNHGYKIIFAATISSCRPTKDCLHSRCLWEEAHPSRLAKYTGVSRDLRNIPISELTVQARSGQLISKFPQVVAE
jgi:hypothetical protein